MDDLRPRGPGRLVLGALAIASALGFLALLMVQAMAFYAPPPEGAKVRTYMLGPATKAAPVLSPRLREELEQVPQPLNLFPGTKAGTFDPPVGLFPPAPAPQRRNAPPRN